MAEVRVPGARLPRWVDNFATRHGATTLTTTAGRLTGVAADGSRFGAALPFGRSYAAGAAVPDFVSAMAPPPSWGLLLVRKGGFGVARMAGVQVVATKVGRRHVQGRSKAGGQSQRRFARRRDNQARLAYEAAGEHAARLLGDVPLLVLGGDPVALEQTLREAAIDPRRAISDRLAVAEPRREVLDRAVVNACAAVVRVENADEACPQ